MLLPVLPFLLAIGGQTAPPLTPPPRVVAPAPVVRQVVPGTIYDEAADAKAKIAAAIKGADLDDIRVLINWGANDDRGRAFAKALQSANVRATRFNGTEYKVVNVDVGRLDKNVEVARSYGAVLERGALPALTVLDHAGKPIAQATARDFAAPADPAAFDSAKIAAFFTKHQAPAPNAVAPFEAALKQAKQDGRTVFVWFSAPW
jgi:hypothetical protein